MALANDDDSQAMTDGDQLVFHTKEEIDAAFEAFQRETQTGWRRFTTRSLFGQSIDETVNLLKERSRVHWNVVAADGISFPFDGIPFMPAGIVQFQCHQGDDIDEKTKGKRKRLLDEREEHDHTFRRRRNLVQSSKKLGCPAKVFMSRAIKFPQYKVDVAPNGKKPERQMRAAAARLKGDLQKGKGIETVQEFVLKLPDATDHQFHVTVGEGADLREPIDEEIVNKIKEMDHVGVRTVSEVRRHLTNFVENELFRGEEPPAHSRRRYHPTDNDIRNILSAVRLGERRAPDDQSNLEIKCNEWKISHPDDFIFYRPSVSQNQAREKFLFIYQANWMQRLLLRYGQEMCLMDATYRTCRYALPLFFLCVRSNVGYVVTAVFIPENEDIPSISEVLQLIKNANPQWQPRNMMVDFSLAEIGAIEQCFPRAHIHVCDFHREKAWNEWLSKIVHGASEAKGEVLGYLRNIAKSSSKAMLEKNIQVLKQSQPWRKSEHLRKYFEFWETHMTKWVRFYRDESLRVAIYTNNGIERQNNWLKTSYLESRRNSSISDLVDILLKQFLPDSYKKYKEHNIQCSDAYKKYDSRVPMLLHNRPKSLVQHMMNRLNSSIGPANITRSSERQFTVASGREKYQVWLGSENYLPSCQCMDNKINKLPCKHIIAVVKMPAVGWEALGSSFKDHPLFTLDPLIVKSVNDNLDETIGYGEQTTDEVIPDVCPGDGLDDSHDEPPILDNPAVPHDSGHNEEPVKDKVVLPLKKRNDSSRLRSKCVQSLKMLHDQLYLLQDKNALVHTDELINEILSYTQKHQRKANALTLKNKTLSPKKKRNGKKYSIQHLLPKKRNRFQRRVGTAAEMRKAKVDVTKNKNDERSGGIEIVDVELLPEQPSSIDVWVNIEGIKLTHELKAVLEHRFGWLSDEHIDAAQQLIKKLGTGVGGLNTVTAMTHYRRVNVDPALNQTIQCHNIGGHWVTSSSITGKIIVYESLSTGLNDALKRQLAHLYKHLAEDDGKFEVTVILQQLQNGGSDCGLYCIANAVALASGKNPTSFIWQQYKMRDHLLKCFEQKAIKLFPHLSKMGHCKKVVHVCSKFCTCLKHIPTAKMACCSVCSNRYHYDQPRCIKLTTKQAAALVTDEPFVCHRCER